MTQRESRIIGVALPWFLVLANHFGLMDVTELPLSWTITFSVLVVERMSRDDPFVMLGVLVSLLWPCVEHPIFRPAVVMGGLAMGSQWGPLNRALHWATGVLSKRSLSVSLIAVAMVAVLQMPGEVSLAYATLVVMSGMVTVRSLQPGKWLPAKIIAVFVVWALIEDQLDVSLSMFLIDVGFPALSVALILLFAEEEE